MRHRRLAIVLLAALAAVRATTAAENIDPAADGHQYAWAENVGWVNAEPSEEGGNGAEVTDFALRGWMWSENIGWISLSCDNTSVCGSTQFGVVNDGAGHLSGFAWSENAGWIDFAPTACLPDPTCGVRIDPATGYFSGRAWSENDGWITFSSGAPNGWPALTSWCLGTGAAPGPTTGLVLTKVQASAALSWTAPAGAVWFDVVGGPLSLLRSSQGDFSVATNRCVASRVATPSADSGQPPPPGNGVWFLVRSANCRGRGTYDSGAPSQQGARDQEIAASRAPCP
jgi:hypothetical protein